MTPSKMQASDWPTDPIAAATHRDPYPYYATLAAERPLYRDESLGLWVASSAAAVTAVLANEICRVRPPVEPVPRSIAGSPAGDIFRHLVRQNDGAAHCPFKQAIIAALGTIDPARLTERARERATALTAELAPHHDDAGLTRFIFALPVQSVASLLGVPAARLAEVGARVNNVVIAFSPIADQASIERGKAAASELIDLFHALLDEQSEGEPETLLGALARQARLVGRSDRDVIIANGIGFLSQSYEATAGLIGNALLALSLDGDARAAVRTNPDLIGALIQEVLLCDPPTQNTRRFVAEDGTVAGKPMRQGDAILVMLAAAGRDPAIVADTDRFDLFRRDRRILNFGSGVHACPADRIAPLIAEVAVRHLLDGGVDLERLGDSRSYRRSVNVRMPVFGAVG